MEFKRIAIDTSKHVFTLHGVDERGRSMLRRDLRRQQFEAFFASSRRPRWCWRRAAARITGAAC